MSEKSKVKKTKPLPWYIEHSIISTYVVLAVIAGFIIGVFDIFVGNRSLTTSIAALLLLLVLFVGWRIKFAYIKTHGDAAQLLRVKAQFWSGIAFLVAFIVAILLIMMLLIMLESNNILPDQAATPLTFILSLLILILSFLIAYNTKKQVYRNFGVS